ncbi:hypothetical protein [Mastigocoleus testarum]|uniref:Uncharacterized protein n=1 Tax=Mastigocoleus testarum BC008 TaxID=371196 RepID=A0A0V7ZMZ9_9CYAN|nr:hypothetical protein [Mastigocoleus testarum]KST65543.1 hypothetical protein BC008_42225 [Mastigocoleus testarum BC008]KST66069.1 hypothetical protein BC008_24130 [Mastigocoleus testarum BC008]
MNENNYSQIQLVEQVYKNYVENSLYRQKLEKWYQQQKLYQFTIFSMLVLFLILQSFGQLAILEYSFGERFGLSVTDKLWGFPIKTLIGLLVTASLPLTTLIDESELLNKKIKISLIGIKFSPIVWILLPGDLLLTFQAVLSGNQNFNQNFIFVRDLIPIPVIAFSVAAVSSTFSFCLSKGIIAAFSKYVKAREELQTISIYGINPRPFYKNAEQIRLREEYEEKSQQAEDANRQLEEANQNLQYIISEKQNLEEQNIQDREQLEQLEILKEEQLQLIQNLEQQNNDYKNYLTSIKQLKTKFNNSRRPIKDLVNKVKDLAGKDFAGIDEFINNFSFPKLDMTPKSNDKTVEIPTYYWKWQNPDFSWQDIQLPSELSFVARRLLSIMEQQNDLPVPHHITGYAPRNDLAQCLVLYFQPYRVTVYCRDEQFKSDAKKWDKEAESIFKNKLVEEQISGYCVLEITTEEIMSHPLDVLERIKNAISSTMQWESN